MEDAQAHRRQCWTSLRPSDPVPFRWPWQRRRWRWRRGRGIERGRGKGRANAWGRVDCAIWPPQLLPNIPVECLEPLRDAPASSHSSVVRSALPLVPVDHLLTTHRPSLQINVLTAIKTGSAAGAPPGSITVRSVSNRPRSSALNTSHHK